MTITQFARLYRVLKAADNGYHSLPEAEKLDLINFKHSGSKRAQRAAKKMWGAFKSAKEAWGKLREHEQQSFKASLKEATSERDKKLVEMFSRGAIVMSATNSSGATKFIFEPLLGTKFTLQPIS